MADIIQEQEKSHVFALDIGTRSVIGVVGRVEEGKLRVLAIESANHGQRAMLDGQIENIGQVAAVARDVVARLERRTQLRLTRVCVAAAGRALRSEAAAFTLELSENQTITDEIISELEAGAVSEAEKNMTAPGNRGKNADAGNIVKRIKNRRERGRPTDVSPVPFPRRPRRRFRRLPCGLKIIKKIIIIIIKQSNIIWSVTRLRGIVSTVIPCRVFGIIAEKY